MKKIFFFDTAAAVSDRNRIEKGKNYNYIYIIFTRNLFEYSNLCVHDRYFL